MASIDELKTRLDDLLEEVNRPTKVDSPLFKQHAYDFSRVLSECGKLWARTKAHYEGEKSSFEIWLAMTEMSCREHLEAIKEAKGGTGSNRVTEAQVTAYVKTDKDYKLKRQQLVDAEELFNLTEKALYDAAKLRGFVSNAIVKKKED